MTGIIITSPTIRPEELVVLTADGEEITVGAPHGTQGLRWPLVIKLRNFDFVFESNEIMTSDLIDHFGGHAKYVLKKGE